MNIALELISDTPVLFLDEPTSGLSSYDAAGVIEMLKQLSRAGKTIVATIHQPSIDVFRKFDNLIMISAIRADADRLSFSGPRIPTRSGSFTTRSRRPERPGRRPCPTPISAPEMLLTGPGVGPYADWADRFSKARATASSSSTIAQKARPPRADAAVKASRRFDLRQWLTLVRRSMILKVRDRAQLVILLLQAPLFGTLIVLVFGRVANPRIAAGGGAASARGAPARSRSLAPT